MWKASRSSMPEKAASSPGLPRIGEGRKQIDEGGLVKVLSLRVLLALVFAWAALSGCAISPTTKDGASLKSSQGLLAFHVTSNADASLSFVDYASTSTFGSRFGENMVGPKGSLQIKAG